MRHYSVRREKVRQVTKELAACSTFSECLDFGGENPHALEVHSTGKFDNI